MMASNLNTDERKRVTKEYWKCQNAITLRTKWVETFSTLTPKRKTIYRIRDKEQKVAKNLPEKLLWN